MQTKQVIEGQVVKAQWRDGHFGRSLKVTVRDESGNGYWGTCAAGILRIAEPKVGDRIRFTANVETSDKPTFFFFNHPTDGKYVTTGAASAAAAGAGRSASVWTKPVPVIPATFTTNEPRRPEQSNAPTTITKEQLLAAIKVSA